MKPSTYDRVGQHDEDGDQGVGRRNIPVRLKAKDSYEDTNYDGNPDAQPQHLDPRHPLSHPESSSIGEPFPVTRTTYLYAFWYVEVIICRFGRKEKKGFTIVNFKYLLLLIHDRLTNLGFRIAHNIRSAALNSVNLGYDLGVSTQVGPLLADAFELSTEQLEAFLGSLNFWSMGGALLSPYISDQYGRQATLQMAALGFVVGVGLCAVAPTFEILMVGRAIVGLGVGIGEAIDPMYIAEIAPTHIRGALTSLAEAGVAVGVVLGFASSLLPTDSWRILLGLGMILPCIMMGLTCTNTLPESPRWLVANGKEDQARIILQYIYPTTAWVDTILQDMKDSIHLEEQAQSLVGWKALLCPTSPAIRRMLLVGIGIAIIQQAVGIDSIMFYLLYVLQQSGVETPMGQDLALIGLGLVKLVFVFVGARYFDSAGRRPLLFLSLGGMAVSLLVVSLTFSESSADTNDNNNNDKDHKNNYNSVITVGALAVYLAFFSIGLGPGNWVVVSEIFAPSIRAKAMMLAVLPNRMTATLMASTFLSVAQAITWPGFFLLLAGICMASMVFLFCYLPETKGKSLEDMVGYFAHITNDTSILELEAELRNRGGQHGTTSDNFEEENLEMTDTAATRILS